MANLANVQRAPIAQDSRKGHSSGASFHLSPYSAGSPNPPTVNARSDRCRYTDAEIAEIHKGSREYVLRRRITSLSFLDSPLTLDPNQPSDSTSPCGTGTSQMLSTANCESTQRNTHRSLAQIIGNYHPSTMRKVVLKRTRIRKMKANNVFMELLLQTSRHFLTSKLADPDPWSLQHL